MDSCFAMLTRPNKAETAVRGCYLGGSLIIIFFWEKRPSVSTIDALVGLLWLQLTTNIIIHLVL